ncbi:MAG: hypothetical protein AVW06_04610 [Hadesarchaea archaeon DG-33-1]|nr:MAG: hypothetical protein AVW06_04610 [Hadesarchaea archaeon DG-33-1]
MKVHIPSFKHAKWLKRANWLGVVTAILMIVLIFLGGWWRVNVGGGAAAVSVSPFSINTTMLGDQVSIPIVWYITLGVKLLVLAAGIALLVGSLAVDKWWSKRLIRFGATKILWMVVFFLVSITLMTLVMNKFLAGTSPELEGFNMPYVSGSTVSTLELEEDATATIPISLALTKAFAVAVAVAILGVATRIYQRRLSPPIKH